MSQKGLTYFFILVFLISSGMVFSKPGMGDRLTAATGNVVQPVSGKILIAIPGDVSNDSKCRSRILTEYQCTPIEVISGFSLKNHILSKRYFPDRAEASRTSLWFNTQIRN